MYDSTRQYSLGISVNNNPVTEYSHDNNIFIEGRDGSRFAIDFQNNSYERVEVILSVDGLNVLDGNQAGEKGPGYVVNSRSSIRVEGWTKSLSKAQEFYFTGKDNSYSNRIGKSGNTGVIGAMIFREKPKPIYNSLFLEANTGHSGGGGGGILRSYTGSSPAAGPIGLNYGGRGTSMGVASGSTSDSYSGNAITVSQQNLGAGWGTEITQNLSEVAFQKRDPNFPDALIALYYDDAKGLEKRGIVISRSKAYPEAFPAYTSSTIGCPDPTK